MFGCESRSQGSSIIWRHTVCNLPVVGVRNRTGELFLRFLNGIGKESGVRWFSRSTRSNPRPSGMLFGISATHG